MILLPHSPNPDPHYPGDEQEFTYERERREKGGEFLHTIKSIVGDHTVITAIDHLSA